MNLLEIFNNPDLRNLPLEEQRKFAAKIIPDMGGLPLEEQNKFLTKMGLPGFESVSPIPSPVAPEPTAPGFDPTAQSIAMGAGPVDWAAPAKVIGGQAEAIGTVGAPLMAGAAALPQFAPQLTNAAAYLRALPIAAPIAGMGAAAGGIIADAAGAQKGAGLTTAESMGAPMPDDPTAASLGMFQSQFGGDFAVGAGAQGVGDLAALMFGRVLAPARKGLSAGASAFKEFAEKKGLPYGAELADSKFGSFVQGLSDRTGLGRYLNDAFRRKQIDGVSKIVANISEELGMPVGPNLQGDIIQGSENMQKWFRGIVNRNLAYKDFNKAIDAIPEKTYLRVEGLMDQFEQAGGLDVFKQLQGNATPSQLYYTFKRAMKNDNIMTKEDIMFINKSIWREYKQKGPEFDQFMGKVKEGYLETLDTLIDPNMGSIGALRRGAEAAIKDGWKVLNSIPIAKELIGKSANLEAKINKFFNPYKADQAIAIKDHLIAAGQGDVWNAVTNSWIRTGFDKASELRNKAGERTFQPGIWLDWWKDNKYVAEKLTPELVPALSQWENIAMNTLKTIKKESGKEYLKILASGGLTSIVGGIGFGAGGTDAGIPLVIGTQGFSLLASLLTMGKGNWGFLRNYALKESASLATPALKAGVKTGYVNIAEELPWAQ